MILVCILQERKPTKKGNKFSLVNNIKLKTRAQIVQESFNGNCGP